jgi:hypothetical protein
MNAGKTLFSQLMDCLPWARSRGMSRVTVATTQCKRFHALNNTGPWRSPNSPPCNQALFFYVGD